LEKRPGARLESKDGVLLTADGGSVYVEDASSFFYRQTGKKPASGVIGKSTSEWKRESSVLYA
jgi:hypothetical protein